MNKFSTLIAIAFASSWLSSCSQSTNLNKNQTEAVAAETGMLNLVANGEDFVRQGFVSKDGWQISFNHLYVTLADVTAYVTEVPFDPETKQEIKPQKQVVLLEGNKTVDLAEGEADAEPIVVNQIEAPVGMYNASSWQLVPAQDAPASGQTIYMDGVAEKDGQTINFVIGTNFPVEYVCGEFVGEERKGIVQPDATGELETTFHFDHLFGDQSAPATDALNQEALGFQPLAELATAGKLEVDQSQLQERLSSDNYQKWQNAIAGLAHVGEGHCAIKSQ
ncbi:hypothetical protein STA3757_21640 [Stanieria sp. NIES-3757]|nr:hypothetical protein STA3757_21640 [Stanieria sp. NIES-3757]